jgi:hypothetical protein
LASHYPIHNTRLQAQVELSPKVLQNPQYTQIMSASDAQWVDARNDLIMTFYQSLNSLPHFSSLGETTARGLLSQHTVTYLQGEAAECEQVF